MKVIELASVLAGPAVGMFFAELGAEVVKIENKKTGGDVTRSWLLTGEKEDCISSYYASVNWNKKVLFLDLSDLYERNSLYELIKDADIVVANHRKSHAQKLGIDYDTMMTYNPKLIYANITGFGDESDRVAFDVVLQAESGFMFMNGQFDGPPTKMPVALIDVIAAHHLKEGILYALWQREKNGRGAYVSVSLLDAAISSLANQASGWLMSNIIPNRKGSLHPNIAPYGEIFETKDNTNLVAAIGNDKQFNELCIILNCKELAENQKFIHNLNRVLNRKELFYFLDEKFRLFDSEYILNKCLEKAVPIGKIRNMREVFEMEEAQNLILNETIDRKTTSRVATKVFKYVAKDN